MKRIVSNLAFVGASCGFVSSTLDAGDTVTALAVAVQDVRLQEQGLLVGRTVTKQGVARGDVKVAISFHGKPIAEATTNEQGMFAVAGLRGGVHVVQSEGKQEVVRLWTADAAPDKAAEGLVLADGQVVRGQGDGGVGSSATNNLLGVGFVGATAGTAIAVAVASGDSSN